MFECCGRAVCIACSLEKAFIHSFSLFCWFGGGVLFGRGVGAMSQYCMCMMGIVIPAEF